MLVQAMYPIRLGGAFELIRYTSPQLFNMLCVEGLKEVIIYSVVGL